MPSERELKILGESVAGKLVLEIACGGGQSAFYAITEERGLLVKRSYFDRTPIVSKEAHETEVDFHRTYGDWHRALTDAGFIVTDIVEPEPLPRESTYSDVFPLSKIQMIPGTTIWRARKPSAQASIEDRPPARHRDR